MAPKRVLIVDDHPLYRSGLKHLLEPRFDVVDEAREGQEALKKALMLKPDVVLMDFHMPGMDGVQAARQIKERLPSTSVVIITMSDEDELLFAAVQAGVSGYVLKDDQPENILRAVDNAAQGLAYLPPLIAKRLMQGVAGTINGDTGAMGKAATPLSGREISVLRLMGEGRRNRAIASELGISERTVGNHITNIYNKLAIYDRAEAIIYGVRTGIVRLDKEPTQSRIRQAAGGARSA